MRLKIGEFARFGDVSVRMLRHYDKVGLLHPEMVDSETGFRYYAKHQLRVLHRIRDLQSLGFSLKEIASLLEDDDTDRHHRQLWEKRRQLQQAIREQQRQLRELEYRMSQIEDDVASPLSFSVKMVPDDAVVSMCGLVPYNDFILEQFYTVSDTLDTQKIGVCKTAGIKHRDVFEWAFYLETSNFNCLRVNSDTALFTRRLQGTMVASAMIQGSYAQSDLYSNGFIEWAALHGYQQSGAVREHYYQVVNRDITHPDNLMELQVPIAMIVSPVS